jgi:DNA-binding PadR family transcriptional regulator
LENLGYVEGEWDSQKKRKRKTYRITDAGKMVLERALAKESQITDSMSGLIKQFMKDILNIEIEPIQRLRRPPFFSVFLEDRKEKPEDMTNILENKRKQIENMIEELQKQLGTINRRMAQISSNV